MYVFSKITGQHLTMNLLLLVLLSSRRVNNLCAVVNETISNLPYCTPRTLAKVAGSIISTSPVIGSLTRLMTRNMYRVIQSNSFWDSRISLSYENGVLQELFFWRYNISHLNARKLFEYKLPDVMGYSDASSLGHGAFILSRNKHI